MAQNRRKYRDSRSALTIVEVALSSPVEPDNEETTAEAEGTGIWLALFVGLSGLATLLWIGVLIWLLSTLMGFP
jgi:hypothetical protein